MKKSIFIISFVMCLISPQLKAQITLPRIIRDSMVLQRNEPIKIWGWAIPGERIRVDFKNKVYQTQTLNNGQWSILLPEMKEGGPYTMTIKGKNKIILKDILIGEVWMCAGQSNMVYRLKSYVDKYREEIKSADNPFIRLFEVPMKVNLIQPEYQLESGNWKATNPQTVLNFSAVAYFFAKSLYDRYGVPIGIINSSVGGIPIESLMSEESLLPFPSIMEVLNRNKDTARVFENNRLSKSGYELPRVKDIGIEERWYDTSYKETFGWRRINVPGYWNDQGVKDLHGIVWYRKEINIPESVAGSPAIVHLGRIIDADQLYINGMKAGETTYRYPTRRYEILGGVLKPGINLFAIRVTNYAQKGGFVPDNDYSVTTTTDTVDLKGYWHYKVSDVFEPVPDNHIKPIVLYYQPTSLYNTMIAPILNYRVRGFAWYQGEANSDKADQYLQLLPAMIHSWRKKWNTKQDAPFLIVQLPGFYDMTYLPQRSNWAELREAQRKTAEKVNNAGLVVTIDLGEWNNIHPSRKKEVGERLSLQAQKIAYGEKGVFSGPMYASRKIIGDKIEINFLSVGSGLKIKDGKELGGFEIAAANGDYVNAKAIIQDNKVMVWSDEIKYPVFVRYAWANNPPKANLFNEENLPASPFSTE